MDCLPREEVLLPFEAPRVIHHTKGALGEELQVIATEIHLILISTRGDDPRLEALASIDQAANKAITLFQKLFSLEHVPK